MGNIWRNHREGEYYDHPSKRKTSNELVEARKDVLDNEIAQLKAQREHCQATIRDIGHNLEIIHARLNELKLIERA